MIAPTLFDQGADLSRATDPATSHAAAESMTVELRASQEARVLEVITAAREHGAIVADVQAVLTTADYRPERGPLSRRCTSLRDAGAIVAVGTRPGPTNRPCTVWVAARYAPAAEEGAA